LNRWYAVHVVDQLPDQAISGKILISDSIFLFCLNDDLDFEKQIYKKLEHNSLVSNSRNLFIRQIIEVRNKDLDNVSIPADGSEISYSLIALEPSDVDKFCRGERTSALLIGSNEDLTR
jgi:hypothetical protein